MPKSPERSTSLELKNTSRPLQRLFRLLGRVRKIVKVILAACAAFIAVTALFTAIVVFNSGDPEFNYSFADHWVSNLTQINSVRVARAITPRTKAEIVAAITETTGPISIGGGRYSQGGQVAYPDSLHIDMRQLNQVVAFDQANKTITVQAGMRWRDIQDYIDPHNLSLKIMQTYSNFSVGGSLSVNAHGRYVGEGPLVNSVQQITLILASGEEKTASPSENPELFYGAIGGYGGLGVIVEAQLQLVDNIKVARTHVVMPTSDYKKFFFEKVREDSTAVFTNADIYPPDYTTARSVTWYKTDAPLTETARLIARDTEYVWGPRVVDWIASFSGGNWLRQHLIDPIIYMANPVVWRNYEASYDVRELEPKSRTDSTYVLREYFVPVAHFDEFVPQMRSIFRQHNANIINVSIRHAKQDPGTLLAWAKSEVFAFVVYYRQDTSRAAQAQVKAWSRAMNEAAIALGGSYYLPYQIYETRAQFSAAYPRAQEFFALKRQLDPEFRLRNQLWSKLYPDESGDFDRDQVAQYLRAEEQTFLTIPKWYLVFNPQEYADYLQTAQAPGEFPFWQSIGEYWRLYDRVKNLTQAQYPPNDDYFTMLNVIGVSTTVEYIYKGAYEKTIGRFTWWLANGQATAEDKIIAQAQAAYSQLMYDEAWYKFDFFPWVKKIWQEDFFGANFLRKLERKLFFSMEFSFKAAYAQIIGYAAQNTYEPSDGYIYMTAVGQPLGDLNPAIKIIQQQGEHLVLGVPRRAKFTQLVPPLVAAGVQLQDISGNRRIAASLLGSAPVSGLRYSRSLFAAPLVSAPLRQRLYVYMQVDQLHQALAELQLQGYTLEHLYDY